MLGFHLIDDAGEALGFMFCGLGGLEGRGELGGKAVSLKGGGGLGGGGGGELGAEVLEGDFEVPVFFFVFV
jgi:hypothetical protein